jgi:hypothetical protein
MIDLVLAALTAAAPCPQLPLTPGTSWTYRAEVAWSAVGADSVQRTTIDWTTTILTVETRDSTSVATVRDWPTGLAWWEPDQPPVTSLLVCIAERIYHTSSPSRGSLRPWWIRCSRASGDPRRTS